MAEEIGLRGVFDLSNFDAGVSKYLARTKEAEGATDKAAGTLSKGWDQMGKSVLNASAIMGKALVAATAAATAAVAGFVVSGIKGAMDLEAQLSTIASVLGVTTDQVGPLKDAVYDLALNPALKVGVDEAALAMENLARNGLTMEQILGGAAEATVLLANATGADFGMSADIASDAMAIFNIKAEDMMQAVNGIVSVANVSKFGIEDYALALAQGGGVAKSAGVSFNDFNTTIAAISPLFASGSDAGTSLKTMMTALIPKSNDAADMMRKLGLFSGETNKEYDATVEKLGKVEAEMAALDPASKNYASQLQKLQAKQAELTSQLVAGKNAFYDQNGNLKSMNEISVLLQGALAGLSEEERNNALATIFGTDAMRAAVALADSGEVVYTDLATASKELGISQDELRKYIEGGITAFEALQARQSQTDALQNAKTNTDNFKSALSMLTDTIDAISRRIGDLFLPMLQEMALKLNDMAGQMGPTIIAAFENVRTVIEDFQAGAFGFDYDWSKVFPPTLAGIVTGLSQTIEFVVTNFNAFAGAIAGVAIALAASGIHAAIVALGVVIAELSLPLVAIVATMALVGAAWSANWFGIRDTTLDVIAALQAAFGPLLTTIMQFGGEALQEILAFVGGTATEFSAVTTITQAAGAAFAALFAGIGPAAMTAIAAIQTWAIQLGATILANYPMIAAATLSYSAALVNWIGEAVALGITALGEWVAGIITWISGTGQSQLATSTGPLISALIDWIANDLIPKVGPAMMLFGLALGGAILNVAQALGTAALTIGAAIVNAILGTDWSATGTSILTLLQAGFDAAKGALISAATAVATAAGAAFAAVDWKAVGRDILTMLTTGLEAGKALLISAVTTVSTNIQTAFKGIDWSATGQAILDGIKTGIERARSILTATATTIIQGLRTAFLSSGINWGEIGRTVIDGIRLGLEAAKGALGTAASAVAATIKDYFSENQQSWSESGRGILDNIRTGFESAKTATFAAISNVVGAMRTAFESVDWAGVGRELLLAIGRGIGAAVGFFVLGVAGVVMAARAAFLLDWESVGQGILNGIKAGATAIKTAFVAYFGETATNVSTAFTSINWQALGSLILNAITAGVGLVKQGFIDGFGLVAGDALKQFTDIKWAELGGSIIESITEGVSDAASGLASAVSDAANNALDAFADIDWAGVGEAIIDGIVGGIDSAGDAISDRLTSLAEDAWNAVKDTLGISSPSKVFAEIGRNIVEGLIVGIEQKQSDLDRAMGRLTGVLLDRDFATGGFAAAMAGFDEYAIAISDLVGLGADGGALNDFLGGQNKELDARAKILKLFESMRIDPYTIFPEGFMKTPISELFAGLQQAANRTLGSVRTSLETEAKRIHRAIQLDGVMQALEEQGRRLQAVATTTFSGLFDMAASKLNQQITDLDNQINGAREFFLITGSPQAEAQVAALIKQRGDVVAQLADIASQQQGVNLMGGDVAGYTAALQAQLDLVKEAKALGVNTAGISPFANAGEVTPQALANLGVIEAVVARKQAEALRKQIAEALYLGDLGGATNGLTGPAAIYKSKVLDPILAQLKASVLNEAERVRLLAKYNEEARKAQAIQAQQNLVDKLAAQLGGSMPALGQRYQTQVLDPILEKLREQVLTEAERNRLSEEYRQGQEKLLALQREQSKLDFLKEQLDLLKLVKDNELDANWVFQGLTLGINTSISDLLAATTRAVQAMIGQVQSDLQIASPSKVFVGIGKQVMAGLAKGIDSNVVRPLSSFQRAIEVPRGSVSNRSLNMSFGGVTISNGMDLATFETRVQRIMESSLS